MKPKSQVKIEGRVIPGREIALFQIYCPSPWQPTVLVSAQPKNSRPTAGSLAITKVVFVISFLLIIIFIIITLLRKDLELKKEVLIKPPCDELVDQLPHVVWWSCPSRRILRGPKVLHPLPPQFPPLVLPHSPSHLLFLPPSFSCFSSFFSSCFSSCFSSFFFNCLPGHSVLFQYYPNLHPG